MIVNKHKFTLLRAERGLTVKAVMEGSKCNRKIAERISAGRNISPVNAGKIAKFLGVSIEDLVLPESI